MRITKSLLVAGVLFASTVLSSPALPQGQTLNFRDADIRAMIEDVSLITGKTFIIDPRVTGSVTLISRNPVSEDAVFDIFLSTLRVYGYTAVATQAGAYKIVPYENAVTDSTSPISSALSDQLVTEVLRLEHTPPLQALDSIRPLIDPKGRAIALRNNNLLLVVDYAANIARIKSVLEKIDADPRKTELVTLTNTSAREMAETLRSLSGLAINADVSAGSSTVIVPVSGSNTLIIKSPSETLATLVSLAKELDGRGANKSDIRVVKLKYADAEEMKTMLDTVASALTSSTSTTPGGAPIAATNERASISAHKPTNTLVINAAPDMHQALDKVIEKLDIPRAQVLVEAIIVEISDQAAKELGVQYLLSGSQGSDVPFTATNYSNTAPNILAATGALLLGGEFGEDDTNVDGLRAAAIDSLLGLNGFVGGFAGESNGTLFGVIVNALEQDISSNILSTPSVMTLDNAEARLLVGQEIPITTGEALGNNNTNPFRTIERAEVGISLTVEPHISDNNDVRLDITQEVSSVQGTVGPTLGELVTNKREITTTVRVGDGEIIVLGGLIQQDERISLSKVPLLGDIPILGELFKSRSKSREKTNLMVFIRPKIIRNQADNASVTNRKFNLVRDEQIRRNDKQVGPTSLDVILEEVIGAAPIPANDAAPNTPE